jgi:flagellar biosynthesis protein FlhB
MAEGSEQEDRTEAATPRRLQQAREQGKVPLSREVPALAALASTALVLMMMAPLAARDMAGRLSVFLAEAHRWDLSDGGRGAVLGAAAAALRMAAPFVLAALAFGTAAVLLQTRGQLNTHALRPDLSRLSPLAGIRRLISLDSLVETGKSLVKLGAMALAAWLVLSGHLSGLAAASITDLRLLPAQAVRLILRVLFAILAVQAVIAAADVIWVRLRHARSLRMSRHDIREEIKETEGDPRIKHRLRQIRMQRARRRMLAAVPKATVVITNPTHYAVALAYDRATNAAPRVVAKGVDSMAARIREVAAAHRVPSVANPPLARALYRVELETEVPAEHYQAVAEIIAYVWGLGRRARAIPPAAPR